MVCGLNIKKSEGDRHILIQLSKQQLVIQKKRMYVGTGAFEKILSQALKLPHGRVSLR